MSDIKPGDLVTFEGDMYRVTAFGDRRGTFDIVRHPNDMLGDRWRNVPPNELRPVLKQSSGKSSADGYLNTNAHLEAKVAMLMAQLAESQARELRLREALRLCSGVLEEDGRDATVWLAQTAMEAASDDSALREMIEAAKAEEREAIIAAMPGGHSVDPQWVCDMIRSRKG